VAVSAFGQQTLAPWALVAMSLWLADAVAVVRATAPTPATSRTVKSRFFTVFNRKLRGRLAYTRSLELTIAAQSHA